MKSGYRQPAAAVNSQVIMPENSISCGWFCGGRNQEAVTTKESIVSKIATQPPSSLEIQVEELEREVQKQRELQMIHKNMMERTQGYLRHCLQLAQDNGFLHLIIGKVRQINDQAHQYSNDRRLNIPSTNQLDPPDHDHHSGLTSLIDRAKLNGWFIQPHEIDLHEKIGQGSTANIYKAKWRGFDVAVKCMNPEFFISDEAGVTFFAQELETLSRQRHRFVLQLIGACLDPPNHGWVVTELLKMTLKEWLHGPGNTRRKERAAPIPLLEERVAKALEISQAMQYLHEQKPRVIHRDLKPSNIFLDHDSHVRVADFGHARFLRNDAEMALTGETGTYIYMAPEVIRCEPYNEKCDVYSFGVILNELVTGQCPYVDRDYGPAKIAMEVGEGKLRPKLAEDNENGEVGELTELICHCWDQDVSIRPSFTAVSSTLKTVLERLCT